MAYAAKYCYTSCVFYLSLDRHTVSKTNFSYVDFKIGYVPQYSRWPHRRHIDTWLVGKAFIFQKWSQEIRIVLVMVRGGPQVEVI